MANVTSVNVPQGDFVTTTLNGAISAGATSLTIGTGLTLDAGGGFLQIDYDSSAALGAASGPETIAYTAYVTGTGAVTGVTRAQAGTTGVSHANGASVQCGTSSMYALNGTTLGYAQITTTFSSSTTGSDVDVTGLTTTVVVPAGGRRIKITGYFWTLDTGGVAGTQLNLRIKEGATVLQQAAYRTDTASYIRSFPILYSGIPTAGSHTYKIAINVSASGFDAGADATAPGFILVELI